MAATPTTGPRGGTAEHTTPTDPVKLRVILSYPTLLIGIYLAFNGLASVVLLCGALNHTLAFQFLLAHPNPAVATLLNEAVFPAGFLVIAGAVRMRHGRRS